MLINLCIFASGRGSNAFAIFQAVEQKTLKNIKIAAVICDNPQASVLHVAKQFSCPVLISPKTQKNNPSSANIEAYIKKTLHIKNVDLICLAGYMNILKYDLLTAFEGRIINIHPSLLPKYPGLNPQKKSLENGELQSGCTVHLVDKGIDTGKILGQKVVEIDKNDTVELLSKKILQVEHILYIEILLKISENWDCFIKTGEITNDRSKIPSGSS